MNLEELIESTHPKSDKERRRMNKILSQVSVSDINDIRSIVVPKYCMGAIHDDNWYCWNTLREAQVVEEYEKTGRSYAACVKDCYGKYWYKIELDDNVYDDYFMVYISVKNEAEAETLFRSSETKADAYFFGTNERMLYPHIRSNISDYMWLETTDVKLTCDEYLVKLVENNILT